jgi:RNA polymerase sigma factor (sigma-70 family)
MSEGIAFAEAWEAYKTDAYRVISRIFSNRADQDDAYQLASIKAWKSWDSFRCETSVNSWFRIVVRTECLMYLRKQKRWFKEIPTEALDPLLGSYYHQQSADDLANNRIVLHRILNRVARLGYSNTDDNIIFIQWFVCRKGNYALKSEVDVYRHKTIPAIKSIKYRSRKNINRVLREYQDSICA